MAHKVARRLRLDTMLRELGARTAADKAADAKAANAKAADDQIPKADGQTAKSNDQTAKSDGHTSEPDARPSQSDGQTANADFQPPKTDVELTAAGSSRPESITVGELVDKAARSGFGFLIAVLALVAIPFFGLSTPFGLAIALVGFQLFVGRERPWLPKRARKRRLKMTMLDRILGIVTKRMRWLAASTRKRWQPMIMPRLVGFGVVLLGLGLALPLPIPGSNLIFIIPVAIYAIGLLEGDGMWIVIAHLATLVDMALLVVFGATVLAVLRGAWGYVF